ncbi:hypothetical protein [Streptomyces sp. NPDC048442]
MRYSQGGGLTDERRAFREKIRLEAADPVAQDLPNGEVARELWVSVRST